MSAFVKLVGPDIYRQLQCLAQPVGSVDDLLSRDSIKIANELSISIQELERIKISVASKLLKITSSPDECATWKSLKSALPMKAAEDNSVRPLGIQSLDSILKGGLPCGSVCSFVGTAGSGKSYICSSSAAACSMLGMKVLLISATNDILLKRLQFMMENVLKLNQNPNQPYSPTQVQELLVFALSNIHVHHCCDIWSLMDLLCQIKDHNIYDVVIVDSLHQFVAPLTSVPSSAYSNLTRGTTVNNNNSGVASASSGASGAGGTVGAVGPATAAEFANSLLIQVGVLLKSLAADGSSVLLTNTPLVSTTLQRRTSVAGPVRTGSVSSTGAHNTAPYELSNSGNGMTTALLDLVDVVFTLEKVPYDRSQSIRDLFNQSGSGEVAAGLRGSAPTPTVIRAGKKL